MIITFIGLAFVILGFLEIKIPFISAYKAKPVSVAEKAAVKNNIPGTAPIKSLPCLVPQAD